MSLDCSSVATIHRHINLHTQKIQQSVDTFLPGWWPTQNKYLQSIKTIGKAISCSTAKEILLVEILQHRREPGNSVWAPWKYVELNFQARHLWLSRAEHCAQPDHSSKSSPTPPSIYFCCPLCCRMRPLLLHRDFPWQRKMGRDLILCFGLLEELQITFLALFG